MKVPTTAFAGTATLLAIVAWIGLAMMFVHELGHVVAAIATGGTLGSVELRPGFLSHTLVVPNPRPAVVLWSGFLSGWLVPLLTAPVWRYERGLVGPTLRAWAAFCLLAGGLYLAIGGTERLTDTGELVRVGWSLPMLITIGLIVAGIGYACSRRAWLTMAQRLAKSPPNWRVAAGWWAWLAAWCLTQGLTHLALQNPLSNVR